MNSLQVYEPPDLDLISLAQSESTIEWHVPGNNFEGPGTHIVTRILEKQLPNSKADALALLHDILYLKYNNNAIMVELVDQIAAENAPLSLDGIVMKVGLGLKTDLGLMLANELPTLNNKQTAEVGSLLLKYVSSTPEYIDVFRKYNIPIYEYFDPIKYRLQYLGIG